MNKRLEFFNHDKTRVLGDGWHYAYSGMYFLVKNGKAVAAMRSTSFICFTILGK